MSDTNSSNKNVELSSKEIKPENTIIVKESPFWIDDPNVLLHSLQFFPSTYNSLTENLNALSRLILVLTLLGFLGTGRITVLIVGILSIGSIIIYHLIKNKSSKKETFENPNTEFHSIQELLDGSPPLQFDSPTPINPFCNVLLTDIEGNPKKAPAPVIDDPDSQDAIFEAAKNTMIQSHPTFPNIDKRLLENLGDLYQFEQSLQPFYSNPATTIPNDQQSFADFCYGSMISCKEGNLFACARNNGGSHYNNY